MSSRKPPTFGLRLEGVGVSPEGIDLDFLTQLLTDLKTAMVATEAAQPDRITGSHKLHLVEVNQGSARYGIYAPTLVRAVHVLLSALAARKLESLPIPAHQKLYEVQQDVSRKNIALKLVEKDGDPDAEISKDRPFASAASRMLETAATLHGLVLKVGGAGTPQASIRLGDGSIFQVKTRQTVAKRLASMLYEPVVLEGTALWDTANATMLAFRVSTVHPAQPVDLDEALTEVARSSGGAWMQIDAERFVEELRSAE